jgi:ribosomal protein S18 acetylase RimI-like enzyme
MSENELDGGYIREIRDVTDPAWEQWKEIYVASFPVSERMSIEFLAKTLEDIGSGVNDNQWFLVLPASPTSERVVAMAFYELSREASAGYLWYIAVRAGQRSRGLGAELYSEICRRVQRDGARLLLFEVEIPEAEPGDADRYAARRIDWYRRLGARRLEGVRYFQEVDTGVPPTEMWIMAHLFATASPDQVYEVSRSIFGEGIERVGKLALA